MGGVISDLDISWSTQVKEIISSYLQTCRIFGHVALDELFKFADAFGERITGTGVAVFDAILAKSVVISITTVKMCGFSFRQLLDCSKNVLQSIVRRAMDLPVEVRKQLFAQLENIITALGSRAQSLTISEIYHNIVKEAIDAVKSCYKSKSVQVAQSLTGVVAEEVVENAVKYSKAFQCTKAALKAGVIIDGACLAFSAVKSQKKYMDGKISWEEHRELLIKRTGGAAFSVGIGAAGTFIGTLVFPGAGTLIGGVIGGMAGDYFGSWAGDKVDKTLFTP